ncbi:hypothetical protein ELH93_34335 [Rhizobium leguminosarum]|uniref:hypothetical protein n=1 Tax=Rhizobium leguminosarum TaxID=384 RepID=UPI00102F5C52|nr:hypothetical protein [Rhizobium leguminosarum]TAY25176.1 hypothetical protein ELH93_34335 [Rhizobium leguminosarum]
MTEQIEGKRFSQVYLRRPDLSKDSPRMRRRLALVFSYWDKQGFSIADYAEKELGVAVGHVRTENQWTREFGTLDIRDVLDFVTVACDCIRLSARDQHRVKDYIANLVSTVDRIFSEEQMGYRVDAKGGVHYAVDQDFENGRVSAITALGQARYNGVRSLYQDAFAALDGETPDGKSAIRHGFFAAESLFRLMFPRAQQLGTGDVQTHLSPLVDRVYVGQRPGLMVAQKRVAAFRSWIEAAHFYRHEPGSEEPAQPPLELAVYMLGDAGNHIRWLAFLDGQQAD